MKTQTNMQTIITSTATPGLSNVDDLPFFQWKDWSPGTGDTADYLKIQTSVYDKGQRIIVCAEKDVFKSMDYQPEVPLAVVVRDLHFVELTIIEQSLVCGDYRPENNHFGYRAKGSDGWDYVCQWKKYDDCSQQPYDNWHRDFIAGTHYTIGVGKRIDKWLIPGQEFHDHYLNWKMDNLLGRWAKVHRQGIVDHINKLFPNTQMGLCPKRGRRLFDGEEYDHSQHGAYFLPNMCFYCKHMVNEIIDSSSISLRSIFMLTAKERARLESMGVKTVHNATNDSFWWAQDYKGTYRVSTTTFTSLDLAEKDATIFFADESV